MLSLLFWWLVGFWTQDGLYALPMVAVAVIFVAGAHIYFRQSRRRTLITTAACAISTYLIVKLIFFSGMPALTGFLDGYLWPLFTTLLIAAVGCVLAAARKDRYDMLSINPARQRPEGRSRFVSWLVTGAGVVAVAAVLLSLAGTEIGFRAQTTARADNANVTVAPMSADIPATDPNNIPVVTQQQAANYGAQVISTAGYDFGSEYQTNQSDYALQSIDHHLYWVAPLTYRSSWKKFSFVGQPEYTSPGVVVVDAESPDGSARVITGMHLHYMPDAMLKWNLQRYLYNHGYDSGYLVDPTVELNDQWQAYVTVAYVEPSLTVTGQKLVKTLVVDPQTGAIYAYDPGHQPAWVDRVISQGMAQQLIDDWGRYKNAGFINFGGSGEMKSASAPELVYNSQDHPVWLVPITSSNGSDNSATGVMLYDTNTQKGTFYPGIRGFGVGANIQSDFESAQANGLQHYPVDSVQLYEIDGAPTWVAIYDNSNGSFAAIGFMDARRSQVDNVVYASNEQSGLSMYQNWLAENPFVQGGISKNGKTSPMQTGVIQRIAPATINNQPGYEVMVAGDPHTYTALAMLNTALPLMQAGDRIRFDYLETGKSTVAMQKIADLTINR